MVPAYVTLGIAGVAGVVGTIFGVKALGSKSDFDKTPSTEAADDTERSALEEAARDGGSAVDIGGTKVVPGAAGLRAGAARNGLPPTLTALLILLGIAALSTMAPGAQRAWGAVGGRFRTHVLRHD